MHVCNPPLLCRRSSASCWDISTPSSTLLLASEPVTALLPIAGALYAAAGRRVMMIDAWNNSIVVRPNIIHTRVFSSPFWGLFLSYFESIYLKKLQSFSKKLSF